MSTKTYQTYNWSQDILSIDKLGSDEERECFGLLKQWQEMKLRIWNLNMELEKNVSIVENEECPYCRHAADIGKLNKRNTAVRRELLAQKSALKALDKKRCKA